MYYNNNSNNTTSDNTQYNSYNGPLFSQPFDPSTLTATSDFDTMLSSSLDSNYPWDFYTQQQIDMPTETILLSDPNYLRQQQLLQEQQKEMHTRLIHDDERHEQVSNLSAMFEPIVVKTTTTTEEENNKNKKDNHRRQQVIINDDDKVDHQRRFNELQARFRVNYARKQVNHVKPTNKTVKSSETTIIKQSNTPLPPPPTNIIGGLVMKNNNEENTETRTMPIQIERVSRLNNSQPFDAESHQRQLDLQLDKVDFDDITVSELKDMLRQRGKPATGKKAVLLQRLQEERDISKGGGRSLGNGNRLNRHSQPVPFSRSLNVIDSPQRPKSFQGTSPVMIHNNASPSSPSASLHRSIANMHIGSPPTRRYSPYSPRLSSSPKPVHHEYSSSVPLSSSPINNTSDNNSNNMLLSSSYSAKSCRYYNNPKTYKPFMSSALATPDREEDINPFDSYYSQENVPIKEETIDYDTFYPSQEINHNVSIKEEGFNYNMNHGYNGDSSTAIKQEAITENENYNNFDWMDPSSFDILLQQQQQDPIMDNQQFLSNDQLLNMLNNQQQQQNDFKLDDSHFNHSPSYYYRH